MRTLFCFFIVQISLFAQGITPPTFSVSSGFYDADFDLALSHTDQMAQIIYTTDGSDPSLNNLSGKTYHYKKQYPEFPGQLPSEFPFFENKMMTYVYTNPILIYDRSSDSNRISEISTTYQYQAHFPSQPLKKSFVVRAKACNASECSKTITQVYFMGNHDFSLPIANITVDDDLLFGYEKGLFVAGKIFDDWRLNNINDPNLAWVPANFMLSGSSSEIAVNFSYFVNKQEVINQNAGLRIHGNGSRPFANRSFRLYAKSAYGADEFAHQFFENSEIKNFKRIIFRNSGSDTNLTMFRDAFIQQLNKSLNIYFQKYQPILSFVNGEFYGIFNVRERFDEKYFEIAFNLNEDDLDFLENDGIVDIGDDDFYKQTLDFFANNDLSSDYNYEKAKEFVDESNFIDYNISQIYASNFDWPQNNNEYFRKRVDFNSNANPIHDGRWRWVTKDLDMGFNGSKSWINDSFKYNTLKHAQQNSISGTPYVNHIFIGFLQNEVFKNTFVNRFADLMNTLYQPDHVIDLIDTMQDVIRPEMHNQMERWNLIPTMANWEENVEVLREFARQRPQFQKQHILDEFNISGIYNLVLETDDIAKGFIKINSIEINNSTPGINDHAFWHGEYFNNIPITLAAVPMPGYKFSYWEKDGKKVDSLIEFTVSLHEDSSFKAFFEFDYASIAGIEKVDFLIYPNPVVDKVTIASYSDSPISYSLFNKAGQLMNKGIIYSNELNISEFNKGVYYIELIQDNKRSYKKILKL